MAPPLPPMFAMICANNVNRRNMVRFPGPNPYEPRIFPFFTPYEVMYRELKSENEQLFRRNGVLAMLERDIITKKAPQKWQDNSMDELAKLDVVLCFEDRIFDIVMEDLQLRKPKDFRPIHVICLDIKDTPKDAKIGGSLALDLCKLINDLPDLEDGIPQAIDTFETQKQLKLLYAPLYI